MRCFILDLAVRGKLVEQDPNDEPASELLKRIATEKARLVKAGEIKENFARKLPTLTEPMSFRFNLQPESRWAWFALIGGISFQNWLWQYTEGRQRAAYTANRGIVFLR